MLQDSAASHVIQMEVEEVNHLPELTTTKPSSTKAQSTKKSTSATSQAKGEHVEVNLIPFGWASPKVEGAPCHPDDTGFAYGSEAYNRQLAAFNKWYMDWL